MSQDQNVKQLLDAFTNVFEKVSEDNRDKQQLLSQLDRLRQEISTNPNDVNRVYSFIKKFESNEVTTATTTATTTASPYSDFKDYSGGPQFKSSLPQLYRPDLDHRPFLTSTVTATTYTNLIPSPVSERKLNTKTETFDGFMSLRQISRIKELEALRALFPCLRIFSYERNNFWQNIMYKFFISLLENDKREVLRNFNSIVASGEFQLWDLFPEEKDIMRDKFCACMKDVIVQPTKEAMTEAFQNFLNTDEDFLASLISFTKQFFNANLRRIKGFSADELQQLSKEVYSSGNNPSELLKRAAPNIFEFEIRIFCFDIISNVALKEEYYQISDAPSGQQRPKMLDMLCTYTAVPTYYTLLRDTESFMGAKSVGALKSMAAVRKSVEELDGIVVPEEFNDERQPQHLHEVRFENLLASKNLYPSPSKKSKESPPKSYEEEIAQLGQKLNRELGVTSAEEPQKRNPPPSLSYEPTTSFTASHIGGKNNTLYQTITNPSAGIIGAGEHFIEKDYGVKFGQDYGVKFGQQLGEAKSYQTSIAHDSGYLTEKDKSLVDRLTKAGFDYTSFSELDYLREYNLGQRELMEMGLTLDLGRPINELKNKTAFLLINLRDLNNQTIYIEENTVLDLGEDAIDSKRDEEYINYLSAGRRASQKLIPSPQTTSALDNKPSLNRCTKCNREYLDFQNNQGGAKICGVCRM